MKRQLFKLLRLVGVLKKPQPQELLERTIFQKGLTPMDERIPVGTKPLNVAFERTPDGQGWITQIRAGRTLIGRLPEADTRVIRHQWNGGHELKVSVVEIKACGLPWERVRVKIERA